MPRNPQTPQPTTSPLAEGDDDDGAVATSSVAGRSSSLIDIAGLLACWACKLLRSSAAQHESIASTLMTIRRMMGGRP
eukprot:CAMPEP_0119324930 /NCGR_PEP_ID=MMETSP1333-20130426/64530_1 /TAXON_ID=418940 /ORGANISM="Scyphosphaera apsteinii, Strain RCC1455" /LENGTH=77 /DNA_ID=CAMNT_0007332765 /DNA_START=1097 /DNA_END=1326 /DNA_ORIENTATION=+